MLQKHLDDSDASEDEEIDMMSNGRQQHFGSCILAADPSIELVQRIAKALQDLGLEVALRCTIADLSTTQLCIMTPSSINRSI